MSRGSAAYQRWRSCKGKRRYATRRDAFRAANAATARNGKAHRVYECEFDEHFHITHQSKALFNHNHEGA